MGNLSTDWERRWKVYLSYKNEVPTEENLSLPAQPNKRDVLVTKKKAGRPPKSK